MEKSSKYIPLLIIVASIVISLFKKKRPVKKNVFPEDVFPDEVFPQQQPFVYEPILEEKIVAPASPKVRMPEKKQHVVAKAAADFHDAVEYEGNNIDLSDPEEARKAIVYHEIFNRN
ncbi:MAG: hypothetical protein LBE71_03650 [Dysgonamonadaceae bacterium]|jgi:hypothetical protein|nr:hypothetical protein [Dysgonamonadaceae bacterium]